MDDANKSLDPHLVQLVLSMQAGAMQQMGKTASPMTGKIERDIEMARFSIDILGMLETKTKGNLSEEEERFLGRVLYELRLNFVDEAKKGDEAAESTSDAAENTESETSTDESPAPEPDNSESETDADKSPAPESDNSESNEK
jgi:hypothetical protein